MIGKTITMGLVGLLVAALVGGSAYILLRPNDGQVAAATAGYNRATQAGSQQGNGNQGGGQRQRQVETEQRAPGLGAASGGGQGRQRNNDAYSEPLADHPSQTWITLRGVVATLDNGILTIETDDGTTQVHLGPEWYWESEAITLAVGDSVAATGFYEDDAFEVARVENLTSGEAVTLRDETGRPLWAGRGNGRRNGVTRS